MNDLPGGRARAFSGATSCMALLLGVNLSACDFGTPELEPARGPPLHLVASDPAPGDGMDCSLEELPDCGVSIRSALVFRFDRFLMPDTATRQSFSVTSGPNSIFLQPRYDVLERVVVYSLSPGQTLRPGARYDVALNLPAEHSDGWGFRAFDGSPLSEQGSAPTRFSFRTRTSTDEALLEPEPPVTFAEVQRVLDKGGCAAASCHQSVPTEGCPPGEARLGDSPCVPVPRMGLDLGSAAAIEATALGRVARETETGPRTGTALEDSPRFGVGMPIIDRGRPDNSYLVYKLLAHPSAYPAGRCASTYAVAPRDTCGRPSGEELSRLADWFLIGDPMPPPLEADVPGALDREDLRVLTRWIQEGAHVDR